MLKNKYEVEVAWEKKPYIFMPTEFKHEKTPIDSHVSMVFIYDDAEYSYFYRGTKGASFATLYKRERGGAAVIVYNPYSKKNEPKYVSLIEAARLVSLQIKNS